jgi:hypothetical protein
MMPVMVKITVFTMRCQQGSAQRRLSSSSFQVCSTLVAGKTAVLWGEDRDRDLNSQLYIDIECVYFYTSIMRSVSVILLVVLAFTVFAPMTSYTLMVVNDGRAFLGTLDVCHSAAPALSSNGEMPCVPIAVHSAIPSLSMMNLEPGNPLFTELILTTCNEHPPRS